MLIGCSTSTIFTTQNCPNIIAQLITFVSRSFSRRLADDRQFFLNRKGCLSVSDGHHPLTRSPSDTTAFVNRGFLSDLIIVYLELFVAMVYMESVCLTITH